ncbi:MAG: cytochrome c3 family protein [Deltaproteobacteria bacterium]|nr:cytochrome c3 family protein [Candidatus Anaeroferrophillus wilburensis]MBN2889792.1 cytochrome c3 family protein [Deltaproteobacteria bacterium]
MKSRKRWILGGMIVALVFLAAPAFGTADEPPASVLLDSLSHLYYGADFNHDQHVEIADDCSVCHHHRFGKGVEDEQCARCHADSEGTSAVVCRDCHVQEPFTGQHIGKMEADPNRYHIDMTGLKGAYHLRCFTCHATMGAPTACEDCHEMTDEGEQFYHSGKYAPVGGGVGGRHE